MSNKRLTEEFKIEAVKQVTERGEGGGAVGSGPGRGTSPRILSIPREL